MIQVKDNIYWLGLRDWDLRRFHGHELSTHRGSTYNTYLIRDEKTILVDTVWTPYKDEFLDLLEKEVGINNIDGIVINHNEPDHGGCLEALMDKIPNVPIYCSKKGVDIIKGHFHKDWNFVPVKTGDRINIGKTDMLFVEMTMIHWPDSMMTYLTESGVLLSNDAFGQHYCSKSIFMDEADECEVYQEAFKYYANILAPFTPLIRKKIAEVKALNLPIEVIAPSHGVIWRKNPMQIIEKYDLWADQYDEGFVTIVYDTMYNATKKMAEAIAKGLDNRGVPSKLYNSASSDVSDIITELFRSKGILLGSCTVNNSYLRSLSGIVDSIKGLKLKGKKGAAFGSYGWSGEAPKHLSEGLKDAGVNVEMEPAVCKYQPTPEDIEDYIRFGESFAEKLG
ncbi:MAG: MBL fold metallo-hydrolase [Clostridiaceae bacterium]|nr:MBL fold metallo-hydrolase [Clostridiaceae bacterium]